MLLVGMCATSIIVAVVIVAFVSPGRTVVLGDAGFMGPDGRGWGQSRPALLYYGGDASGMFFGIRWSSWGGAMAVGRGANPTFKPGGGYYRRPVIIELRATDIRRCTPNGPLAYSRLSSREQTRPGGPLGPWAVMQTNLCINCDPVATRGFVKSTQPSRELLSDAATDANERADC